MELFYERKTELKNIMLCLIKILKLNVTMPEKMRILKGMASRIESVISLSMLPPIIHNKIAMLNGKFPPPVLGSMQCSKVESFLLS